MLELEAANSGKILVIGHRGALGYAPENTLVSFQKGAELGADLVELDVHLSRDGRLIVMHDGDVSRTTNGHGHIKDMTLAEIKRLDAGVKFQARYSGTDVPVLEEVLTWAKGRIPLIIEIKGDPLPTAGIEEQLLGTLRAHGMLNSVMVISFHHPVVRRIKQTEPHVATGILYFGMLADTVAAARASLANSVRPAWSYWTKEIVDDVHAAGLIASTWNADEESRMEYLAGMGLDSIGSDYPDRLRSYVDRIGRAWQRP